MLYIAEACTYSESEKQRSIQDSPQGTPGVYFISRQKMDSFITCPLCPALRIHKEQNTISEMGGHCVRPYLKTSDSRVKCQIHFILLIIIE